MYHEYLYILHLPNIFHNNHYLKHHLSNRSIRGQQCSFQRLHLSWLCSLSASQPLLQVRTIDLRGIIRNTELNHFEDIAVRNAEPVPGVLYCDWTDKKREPCGPSAPANRSYPNLETEESKLMHIKSSCTSSALLPQFRQEAHGTLHWCCLPVETSGQSSCAFSWQLLAAESGS